MAGPAANTAAGLPGQESKHAPAQGSVTPAGAGIWREMVYVAGGIGGKIGVYPSFRQLRRPRRR
jgi:hypothetical protein